MCVCVCVCVYGCASKTRIKNVSWLKILFFRVISFQEKRKCFIAQNLRVKLYNKLAIFLFLHKFSGSKRVCPSVCHFCKQNFFLEVQHCVCCQGCPHPGWLFPLVCNHLLKSKKSVICSSVKENHIGLAVREILRYRQKQLNILYYRIIFYVCHNRNKFKEGSFLS